MKLKRIGLAAIIACGMLASTAIAAPPPGVPDGWSDAFVYSNGARLHYYRAAPKPGKPVIVMVHGVTDNGLTWTTLTKDLQDKYDIYMLDARAHGRSDPFPESATGDTLVEDVVGFIRAMKIEKPILMGHSMGAATVIRLAAQYPDLPRAAIMLDPGLGARPMGTVPGTPPAATTAAAPQPRRPGSMSMFGNPEDMVAQNNDSFENFVATCARQTPLWDPVDCQYWALSKKQYHGAYSQAQRQAMRGTMNTADALAKISVPSLILKADASPEVRANNEKAVSALKNVKLVHVDGAAHNLHHDKRARTVQLLTEFMGKL